MDIWDVIAEESRRETNVRDRGVSFPIAMIRLLSISKGASACVLICTQGTISNGDTNKTIPSDMLDSGADASGESCAVACRENNQESDLKCHWLKKKHGNGA